MRSSLVTTLRPDQQTAIFHAVDVLGHLALAAAAGAFVHEDELILIRRDHGHSRAMIGRPALTLADVEQHGVDALLGARAGIEVVSKDLLMRRFAVVHDHLLAAKVGVAERRGNKEYAALDLEIRRNLAARNHALQIGQRRREKCRLPRHNQQRSVVQRVSSCIERHRHKFLRLEPVQGLLPRLASKVSPKRCFIGRLVGGQIVANHHRIRVAAAHCRVREVDGQAIARLGDDCFDDATAATSFETAS